MVDCTGATKVPYWYVKDAHGNVVGLTDASGTLAVTYSYDAWGNELSSTGTVSTADGSKLLKDANPFRYSSYYFDQTSGLYYLNARYYSPELGRFLSRDPVPGTLTNGLSRNPYLYALNNVANFTDHDGLAFEDDIAPAFNEVRANPYASIPDSTPVAVSSTKVGLPKAGEPNSVAKKYGRNGQLEQERHYGPDGRAVRDRDYTDHKNPKAHPKVPHDHDWDWSRVPPRGPAYATMNDISTSVVAVGLGYVVYRGVRMIPSLLPPLWWTIPVNAVCP